VARGNTRVRIPADELVAALRRVGRGENASGRIGVVIVDDPVMHELNRRYRRRNRPTDVLSFPLAAGAPVHTDRLVGEVYCNYDHARRWRAGHGGTIADELVRLAVHGCLHLLGYDHHTAPDRDRMVRAERKYLRMSGLIAHRNGQGHGS